MIGQALEEVNGKSGEVSLIDYHVNTLGETAEEGSMGGMISHLDEDSKAVSRTKKKPAKGKPAVKATLNITTVRSAQERGETWTEEINERMDEFLGLPSSPARSEKMRSSPVSPGFPSTQPLGESSLASTYARDVTSPTVTPDLPDSPRTPISPGSPSALSDEENIPPMPPSSQKHLARSLSYSPEITSPFRGRGGLRAGGSLPEIVDSARRDQQRYKRIRVEDGPAGDLS